MNSTRNTGMDGSKIITLVAKHFEIFYASERFDEIIQHFSEICKLLDLQPTNFLNFYPALKKNVKACQGINLFKILDERTKQTIYSDNTAASNIKMVVIGAGPIGLRTAIESQLLGAKVTLLEKRTSFSRNNVLHLWPWVIEDLKSLGAKTFYPRFCTGTMNHISIRKLQCILLKTALCFGVEVFGGVEYQGINEPECVSDHWKIMVSPPNPELQNQQLDVVIGAEGKRVTLPGFRRKEFRGKLAIAITANFVNKRTTAEAVVEEISGVAFVYKQDFFNNLYEEFGIALENIVYYKDETHYFVMTAKKHSLLDRKVLKKDLKDPIELLSVKNVNKDALYDYIRDACDYCTDYQLPQLEFALNHYDQPDVALFDFTSMFASGNASHVREKNKRQLLFGLVGDGLLEPFWPTGTGIARGFLGAFDCCWMIKQWAAGEMSPSEVLAERESILKLLPQTTPENITKDFKKISIYPRTRYPNLHNYIYTPNQVEHLYISDESENKDLPRYLHPGFIENLPLGKKIHQKEEKKNYNFHFPVKQKPTEPVLQDESKAFTKKDWDSVASKCSPASKQEMAFKIAKAFGNGNPRNSLSGKKDQKSPLPAKSPKNNPIRKPVETKKDPKLSIHKLCEREPLQLHSSVAPIIPSSDIEIDPELDSLLAELENDQDFQELPENEQKTWLESLFFLDTLHLPGRGPSYKDMLTPTKQATNNTLRVNGSSEIKANPVTANKANLEDVDSSIHVNDKMRDLAKDFFTNKKPDSAVKSGAKSSPNNSKNKLPELLRKNSTVSSRKLSINQLETEVDQDLNKNNNTVEARVNNNLCSLAQSYFSDSGPQQLVERKLSLSSKPSEPIVQSNRQDRQGSRDNKEFLVAAFFDNKPNAQTQLKKHEKVVTERVMYEPGEYEEEEEEEEEGMGGNIEEYFKAKHSNPIEPPPPPPRKMDKQAFMMKVLGNATGILQGKR